MSKDSKEQKILSGQIALNRLVHVKMEVKGKTGMVKGMFIPFEANALEMRTYDTKDGKVTDISMPIRVIYRPEQDDKKQNGFIAKSIPSDIYKAKKDDDNFEEFQKAMQPILGNIKDWANEAPAGANNDVGEKESYTPEDDLPF